MRCNENGSTFVYQLSFTINQNHPLPTRIQTHTHWYFTHGTDNKQHSVTIGLCCHQRIYGSTQAHRRTLGCASPNPSSGIYPRRRRNGWVKRPIKSRSPYTDTRSRTGDSERNNQHLNNNNMVMRGGDTDTNAAICGALLGAVYGRDAVPDQWAECVLNCRPEAGRPHVFQPRPECFWPVDALELAERLIC